MTLNVNNSNQSITYRFLGEILGIPLYSFSNLLSSENACARMEKSVVERHDEVQSITQGNKHESEEVKRISF